MSLRHNDSKHGTPRTRGRTWQRIRLQVLAEEPLCRACQAADRVTAAAEVDHIKPLHHGGTDERSNLQQLRANMSDGPFHRLYKASASASSTTWEGGGDGDGQGRYV